MPGFDPLQPFALFADAGGARLFTRPHAVIEGEDMPQALQALRGAGEDWLAGGFSYESGLALEPRLPRRPAFHWFGRFPPPALLDVAKFARLLSNWRAPVEIGPLEPLVAREDWLQAVHRAQGYIAAGDIYQANLTFPARLAVRGHPLALFARLFAPEAAPHGGLVHDGHGRWWLSFSPELFFRLDKGRLEARPMKGTAPRAADTGEDRRLAMGLAADAKNRAENLMITDLLRNDLGRVAQTGSVRTSRLFEVETYPSVHQMTSSVSARLRPGLDALDALAALFPCGSITGAPKIRAMEIIGELEPNPRGIYCGSLGWIGPEAQAAHFNVAIRTLEIRGGEARLGLGAGIVADSQPEDEWAECLTKARFLTPSAPGALIETMRLEPDGDIPRLRIHLARLQASALRFGFRFDRDRLAARLSALRPPEARRLRVLLAASGEVALQLSPLPPAPVLPARVAIAALPLDSADWRLFHKSNRRVLDDARRRSGCFECLFERPDGRLTEGSFTNLFVERGGRLLTPPAHLGLLPGTLRAELLASGLAEEAELRRDDLSSGFLLGNSLRGMMPARLA
ncbi:aminodeoxychorismate synthase component I [Sandaracinobacter sp. RS1-74]|uniref:aminodeoxychorismate synthase component I n=1 Tax=Sandaracinobacteroides sayramensis TaxID=2913411 RepID=UPI001EDBFF85|nr:aminodeoxychorismate synthase component I [Sandaracinobacteroides sayramensis]MCG2840829.1 aminodeoxychorismate synthase component I [Sandaracinobacteroides sayramensis]